MRRKLVVVGLAGLLTLAGWSATSTFGEAAATTGNGASRGLTTTAGKVSANRASREELQRAFEEAGIPNAAQWAKEVEEYRPYPANDPTFGKLRHELAKYNPSPEVVEKILATLQP